MYGGTRRGGRAMAQLKFQSGQDAGDRRRGDWGERERGSAGGQVREERSPRRRSREQGSGQLKSAKRVIPGNLKKRALADWRVSTLHRARGPPDSETPGHKRGRTGGGMRLGGSGSRTGCSARKRPREQDIAQ